MNEDLVLVYRSIKHQVDLLIESLEEIKSLYLDLDMFSRQEFYYDTRESFNQGQVSGQRCAAKDEAIHVARLIFLNRTCFNGLYRVNLRGEFNVPHSNYRNPKICDAANLRSVSRSLQNTGIWFGDFTACRDFVDANTFVYLDPPYRPISKTANFNSFYKDPLGDDEQRRRAHFYQELGNAGAKLMLSNSGPAKRKSPRQLF